MKKMICIVLLAWLPLFVSAAGAASLQMTLDNHNINTHNSDSAEPACHQHSVVDQSKEAPNQLPKGHHHFCSACGFCAVANGFVHLAPQITVPPSHLSPIQPALFTIAVHSQTYPPAIKPPIL